MSVIVLRLRTRWQWKTILWVSFLAGFVADFSGDLAVWLRR